MLPDNDDDQLAFADRALNPTKSDVSRLDNEKMNLGQTMEKSYLTNWKWK